MNIDDLIIVDKKELEELRAIKDALADGKVIVKKDTQQQVYGVGGYPCFTCETSYMFPSQKEALENIEKQSTEETNRVTGQYKNWLEINKKELETCRQYKKYVQSKLFGMKGFRKWLRKQVEINE